MESLRTSLRYPNGSLVLSGHYEVQAAHLLNRVFSRYSSPGEALMRHFSTPPLYPLAFDEEVRKYRMTTDDVNYFNYLLTYSSQDIILGVARAPFVLEAITEVKHLVKTFPFAKAIHHFAKFTDMKQMMYAPLDAVATDEARQLNLFFEQKQLEEIDKHNQQFEVETVGDPCKRKTCQSPNTKLVNVQTRSGDEAITIYNICNACGFRYRV